MAEARFIDRLRSRIGRDVGIGVEETLLYRFQNTIEMPQEEPDDLHIDLVDVETLACLADIGPCDLEECRARLQRGDQCFGAWIGNELAHYSWVQHAGEHSIDQAGLVVPIAPDSFWIYNCRTAETHRGRGIYPRMLSHVLGQCFRSGLSCAWIYTSTDNHPSQRGIARAGFECVGKLRALRFGRRYLPLTS
jgi:RimJ/RimL family protein N-acetyltransferase